MLTTKRARVNARVHCIVSIGYPGQSLQILSTVASRFAALVGPKVSTRGRRDEACLIGGLHLRLLSWRRLGPS